MMAYSWQRWPERLWGEDWIAPMSEVLNINRRTVERWRAGQGAPNTRLIGELQRLAMRPEARSIGAVLRRMANGESASDIRRDMRAMELAITQVEEGVNL